MDFTCKAKINGRGRKERSVSVFKILKTNVNGQLQFLPGALKHLDKYVPP